MSVDFFLAILVGGSLVVALAVIKMSKNKGGPRTTWTDETISLDTDPDD